MEKKKPEIRFNGFEEEWATTTLGDIAVRVVSKNEDNCVTLPLTISAQYGLISQTKFFNSRIAAKDVRGYYVIKKGEFAYNRSTSDFSPFGAVKRLDGYKAGVLSTLYIVFRLSSEQIHSNYLVNYFSTSNWHQHIAESAAEGARNHGLLNITAEDFFKTPIKAPIGTEEQEKIASFLTTLDNLIVKLEAKLDKLRKLKQALLEKMFTNINRGNEIPEIRFKGFEGEWATTTLGECFLERIERSAEGELISVTISQGVVRASDLDRIDNSSNDKSNYKVVEVGDIAYNSMRMWQGACGYSLYKGICSPAYTVVIPQNNIDVVYCFYLFKRNETLQLFRVNSQGLTSDTWNLKYPAFSQIKCSFPPLSEQRQIGKYFTQIDTHFSKTSTKLTKLRNIKQSLLQKMFA